MPTTESSSKMAPDQHLYRYTFRIRSNGVVTTLSVYARGKISVGRASGNTVVIKHELVSRQHAQLRILQNGLHVIDLRGTNGTFVEGKRLASGGEQVAEWQADIGIGPAVVICLQAVQPAADWQRMLPAQMFLRRYGTRWGLIASSVVVISLVSLALMLPVWELSRSAVSTIGRELTDVRLIPTFTPMPTNQQIDVLDQPIPTAAIATSPPLTVAHDAPMPIPTSAPPATAIASVPQVQQVHSDASTLDDTNDSDLVGATAVFGSSNSPTTGLDWDLRLDLLGITLERANAGGAYWRLVRARWWDEQEAGNTHHIYVDVLDESGHRLIGQPVTVAWADGKTTENTDAKPANEYPFNFPMFAAGMAYAVRVEGLPSDVVSGMGMGSIEARMQGIHVSYLLTFQHTIP